MNQKIFNCFYGAGSPYTTIKDLAQFLIMLLNNGMVDGQEFLKSDLVEEMRTVQFAGEFQDNQYFLGLFQRFYHWCDFPTFSYPGCGYPGWGYGYTGEIVGIPALGIGVIVLTNQNDQIAHRYIAENAVKLLLNAKGVSILKKKKLPQTYQSEVKLNSRLLKRLVGMYYYDKIKVSIKVKSNTLSLQGLGEPLTLIPHNNLLFSINDSMKVKFFLGKNDKPTHFMLKSSRGIVFRYEL